MLTLASVCEGAKEGFLKKVEMDKGGGNYIYVVIQWSIFFAARGGNGGIREQR